MKPVPWSPVKDRTLAQGCEIVKDACAALGDVAFAVSNDRRLRELDRAYIALAIVTIAEHLKSKLGAAEGPQPEEAS